MYGLVNRAIEQLVCSLRGPAGWQRVCRKAGISDDGFLAVQPYPDCMTYRLVAAVSEELQLPQNEVLEAFGEYWILYTAEEGYGELLNAAGSNLREFLGNLDEMHARVESAYPSMVLPWFTLEDLTAEHFLLHYGSQREGLAPMVVGLVKGLAERFGQRVEIQHIVRRSPGNPVDTFEVRVSPQLLA